MKKIAIIFFLLIPLYSYADCPEVLDHEVRILGSSETADLCEYQGKVVLAVNVASQCGYVYQYEALQELYEKYKEEGFVVLGFPSGDFLNQEFEDEQKVKDFCDTTYGVDFPMFKRSHVKNGRTFTLRKYEANPFFSSLIKNTGIEPSWNFNKYLISKDGTVKHFNQDIEPDSFQLVGEILASLKK
jgi:glutathione peroxidase